MCLCDKLFCLHDGRVWNASPARYQGMTEAAAQRGDFIVEGHRLSFATTGPRALDRLCGLIDGARSELLLFYYIFAADAVGHRVRDAIGNARQRGVDVSLIIDDLGSEDTPESFRSEEHTSELQSLIRISDEVICLKKNKTSNKK